jgi:hypothetical protein
LEKVGVGESITLSFDLTMPPKNKKKEDEGAEETKDRIAIVSTQKCKPKKCRQEVCLTIVRTSPKLTNILAYAQ